MPALLLRTPDPLPGESIMGYLLRVSETNGYDSPWHVLKHAGYSQDQLLKASFSVNKLAAILGKDPALLASHAYLASPGVYQLNRHEIGRGLSSSPLRLRRPAICPHCIEEKRFAHVCWDLSASTACPFHRIDLVRSCSSCGAHLRWFRPGLLWCTCGASLAHERTVDAGPAVLELMRILYSIVMREPTQWAREVGTDAPMAQMAAMPLPSLLRLIYVLNKLDVSAPGEEALNAAAEALHDWPNGFHRYLRRMADIGVASTVRGMGFSKKFSSLYSRAFRNSSGIPDIEFVREEFLRFGSEEWGKGVVDKRLPGSRPSRARYVSCNDLARRLGVMHITARRWISSGKLPGEVVEGAGTKRYVGDAKLADDVVRRPADQLETRKAAKLIGLPVSVLQYLKRAGHYSRSPFVNMRTGFWPADLKALTDRILATAEALSPYAPVIPSEPVITFGRILSFGNLGAPQAKGVFVVEVLDGLIVPCGKGGDGLHDLQFRAADVEHFRVRCRLASPSDFISARAAAEIIGCGPHSIAGLAAAGHIRRKPGKAASVVRSSAVEFAGHWRPLAAVAQELRTSPQGLALRAAAIGIACLRIRLNPRQATLFLSRVDAQHLGAIGSVRLAPSIRAGSADSTSPRPSADCDPHRHVAAGAN